MAALSFIFAGSQHDAVLSAVEDWKWEEANTLLPEFIRPDTRERVRWVPDMEGTNGNFRWTTTVYLGRNWERRRDRLLIRDMMAAGLFREGDPKLPPPKPPRRNRLERMTSELRTMLSQMERGQQ